MFRWKLSGKPTILVLASMISLVAFESSFAQKLKGDKGAFGGPIRGNRARTYDLVILAGIEPVQSELKISDKQREEIGKIVKEYRELMSDLTGGSDIAREERVKKLANNSAAIKQLSADSEKKVLAVLHEDQQKRLKEILLQLGGSRALLREDFAKALNLSEDQKKKIHDAIEAETKRDRDALASGESVREKIQEARKQTDEEIKKILTADQQKQLESMKGAKFELNMEARPRGEKKKGV